ncbi:haloacid dehalogenase [Streptomyces sp. CB01201]|uniref:HAD family hydrolase n=1 Tax=Streptomyces sp. CB01201 TaxID=2020324 RepID=UPI000C276870|nr:HAD family phosphatase [Streptomyces sp. CB01201]PJN02331.1 haloacid dehalogenase [Streptomyces sp. CB01201]
MRTDALAETLAEARAVLLDFDGPVCDVFAGLPASKVARELAQLVGTRDEGLGAKAAATDDPIEVLRIVHEADSALGQEVERALTAAEVRAVALAGKPTSGSVDMLAATREVGKPVAVVSNNSAECVREFLALHELSDYVMDIVGRPTEQPHLMKPNPHPLIQAAELLHVDVTACTLIGDSVTDIQAAHAAGATVIGYANKLHKAEAFAELRANAITDDMRSISDALLADQSY